MVRMRSASKESFPRAERPPEPVVSENLEENKNYLDLRCGDWVSARAHDVAARHDICCVRSKAS